MPGIGGVSFLGFSATIASVVQPCNRGCVLERGADDLSRVNDALGHQVAVLPLLRIVTVGIGLIVADLTNNN